MAPGIICGARSSILKVLGSHVKVWNEEQCTKTRGLGILMNPVPKDK